MVPPGERFDGERTQVVLGLGEYLRTHHFVKNGLRFFHGGGDTLPLDIRSDALVSVRCGNVTLTEGRMGRVGDRVAIRVTKNLRKPQTTFAMFEKADERTKMMEAP